MVEDALVVVGGNAFGQLGAACEHGGSARIEVPAEDIARLAVPDVRANVVARLKALGFTYVALDLQGYRTGSMNEAL